MTARLVVPRLRVFSALGLLICRHEPMRARPLSSLDALSERSGAHLHHLATVMWPPRRKRPVSCQRLLTCATRPSLGSRGCAPSATSTLRRARICAAPILARHVTCIARCHSSLNRQPCARRSITPDGARRIATWIALRSPQGGRSTSVRYGLLRTPFFASGSTEARAGPLGRERVTVVFSPNYPPPEARRRLQNTPRLKGWRLMRAHAEHVDPCLPDFNESARHHRLTSCPQSHATAYSGSSATRGFSPASI